MRFHRFFRLAGVAVTVVGMSASAVPQNSTNSSTPAPSQGRVVVVPPTGDAKIIGSTVPASAMPQAQESLGSVARRLRKNKRKKHRKAHRARTTARPRPQL